VPAPGRGHRPRARARPGRRRDRGGHPRRRGRRRGRDPGLRPHLDRDGDRREAWLDCKVDFDGENRVSDFDEDALVRSISYDRDRDRRGNDRRRRGEPAENARAACRETFEQQGYRISDIRDRDRNDNQVRLEMRVERNNGRRFDAVCLYNRERDEARFGELRPVSRN
jgi:hypothetical protein